MSKLILPKSFDKFYDSLISQFQADAYIYKTIQILIGAIFPIFEGILVNNLTLFYIQIILFVIVVIHVIFLFLIVSTSFPLSQFLIEFDKNQKEQETQKALITQYEKLTASYREAINISHTALQALELEKPSFKEIWENILDPWIGVRADIFGFDNGYAMYNFAVYIFDKEQGELKLKFRRCDDRIKRKDRNWKTGIGHVGICFSRQETQFAVDISDSKNVSNQQFSRPEDNIYYKSIIAEPIKVKNEVIGVFIVTSSQSSQFNEDVHVSFVRVIAQSLGLGYLLTLKLNL
jgi:hypothetical protein